MNNTNDSAHVGRKRKKLRQRDISYIMEAMPIPRGWNMRQPAAKGRGNFRLVSGVIQFENIKLSLAERMAPTQEESQPEFPPVDLDPADRILKGDQKRRVRSRESNIDLYELERRINPGRFINSGRFEPSDDQKLAQAKYRNKKEIERIRTQLGGRIKHIKFELFEVSMITAFLTTVELLPRFGMALPHISTDEGSTVIYLIISLLGLFFTFIILFEDIKEGFRSILSRNFSNLSALSAAIAAELIHIVYMLASSLITGKLSDTTFAAPLCLAAVIYIVNRLLHTVRVARGFAFVSKKGMYSEVMAADDSPIAADLRHASGSSGARIAYVVRTRHLSNYFINACREDRCSIMMSRIYPVILIASLVTAVISFIRGFLGGVDPVNNAFSALCAELLTGIPITGLLSLEIPLSRLTAYLRSNGTLLTGWNSVDKFGSTDAFAINTTDLFPRGSIRVRKSFAISDMEIEEITSVAASVLIDAGGALAEVFGELIRDEARLRQRVDSITYETELGISAWVKDKKVLIGNRDMMELHRVLIPGGGLARLDEFDAMRKNDCFQMLYVAVNNRLMGVYMLEYKAAMHTRNALLQLIQDGTNIMIYTCDANITIQLIKSVFDIPPRFISIMDNEGSSVYDSVTFKVTEAQEALIATDGSLKSLSEAIRAAVVLKDAESTGLMIQSICYGIGFLFVAGLSCISTSAIGSVQLIVMQLVFVLLSTVTLLIAMHANHRTSSAHR